MGSQAIGARERASITSPARIVNLAVAFAIAITIAFVAWAQRFPALPFAVAGSGVTEIRAPAADVPFRLEPIDLIEEPDVVGSWAELDSFYARQGEIWRRLDGSTVDVRIDGEWKTVPVVRRGASDLPLPLYTLLAAAFVAWVAGFVTYAFSDRGRAARLYVVSAIAFCVAVWPPALYSSRPLALHPTLFRWLSTADHTGALLFAAGVITLLAVYPVRLVRHVWWLWATAILAAIAGHLQIGPIAVSGFYTANCVQFVLFIGFAFFQWRASRRTPLERAALGWILLSMFVGVIFFFTLITLPVLLGMRPTISQTTGLVSMVLMYVGISLGVLRYRLFDLDRWWFRTWSWILSGMVVVGVDLLLTRLFEIRQNVALIASLVVVGWLYFPIRQLLFERFGAPGSRARDYDTRRLITSGTLAELRARFREALAECFAPLEIVESDQRLDGARLIGEGAWLEVPSPTRDVAFRCHFRENGARLYTREDVARATELVALADSVRIALDARAEGELAERTRIRRDLHDDLGASIIRIAHESPDERTAALAKAAMRDLRDVLTALQDQPITARDALDDLEADLRGRAHVDDRELVWHVAGETDRILSARARANLTRVLRETMTNALKHGTGPIRYAIELGERDLHVVVTNAACGVEPIETGMGLENITARVTELGGMVSYVRRDGSFELDVRLPWRSEG